MFCSQGGKRVCFLACLSVWSIRILPFWSNQCWILLINTKSRKMGCRLIWKDAPSQYLTIAVGLQFLFLSFSFGFELFLRSNQSLNPTFETIFHFTFSLNILLLLLLFLLSFSSFIVVITSDHTSLFLQVRSWSFSLFSVNWQTQSTEMIGNRYFLGLFPPFLLLFLQLSNSDWYLLLFLLLPFFSKISRSPFLPILGRERQWWEIDFPATRGITELDLFLGDLSFIYFDFFFYYFFLFLFWNSPDLLEWTIFSLDCNSHSNFFLSIFTRRNVSRKPNNIAEKRLFPSRSFAFFFCQATVWTGLLSLESPHSSPLFAFSWQKDHYIMCWCYLFAFSFFVLRSSFFVLRSSSFCPFPSKPK